MKANVLGLTAVTADGSLLRTGCRARKSAAGLDLTSLLIGSEGTLAVIVEATLRLAPAPEASMVVVTPFASTRAACAAVAAAGAKGLSLAAAELLDGAMASAIVALDESLLPGGASPTVLWRLSGSAGAVAVEAAALRALCSAHSALAWSEAEGGSPGAEALWAARKSALMAAASAHEGCSVLTTDVCVPLSELPALLEQFEQHTRAVPAQARPRGIYAVAHAGDGNAHHFLVFDPASAEETAAAKGMADWLATAAIRLGGTCTGEHGVGASKLKYLEEELGEVNGRVARAIKAALDPHGILNPGKKIALPPKASSS